MSGVISQELKDEFDRLKRLPQLDETLPQRAFNRWGGEAQILVAVEECAEFIKAAMKAVNRGGPIEDMVAEAADVMFLVYQIRHLWPRDFDEALKRAQGKLAAKLDKVGG